MIDNTIIKHRLQCLLKPQQTDIIAVDYADFERVMQGNGDCALIELEDNLTGIISRLQAEIAKANPDNASNAVLRIGIVRMLRCNMSRCKASCVLSTMQFPM